MEETEPADFDGGGLIRSLGGEWEVMGVSRGKKVQKQAADERILGGGEFVERALEYAKEQESRVSRLQRGGWDFKKVLSKAAKAVGVAPEELLHPARGNARSRGRALLCKWLVEDLKNTQVSVSEELAITRAAVGILAKRGREIEHELGVEL